MDTDPTWFDAAFGDQRMMAILRGHSPERSVRLSERAWDLGLRLVEVPIQTPDAVAALRAVAAAARERGASVGAGTVRTVEQVRVAAESGAVFTVAPGFDPEIMRASHDLGLAHLPGVATPTDIHRALTAGLRWLKAFPASVLGTAWFRAMAGPFPGVPLVATGGIDAANAGAFLAAGARAVAVGSALEDERRLAELAELSRPTPATSVPGPATGPAAGPATDPSGRSGRSGPYGREARVEAIEGAEGEVSP